MLKSFCETRAKLIKVTVRLVIILKYLEGKKRRILNWLCPVNPEDDYSASRALHTEGTGDWIFEEDKFKFWLATPGSFLWVHGQSEIS